MGYRKILLALDGSKQSERAIQHVVTIADPHAYIHVLSVMAPDRFSEVASFVGAATSSAAESAEHWPAIDPVDDPHALQARQDYLKHVTDWLAPLGFDVTVDTRPGDVIQTILETARDGFEIIVMTTHGRTGIAKVVVGSVAEGVLHAAPCPVLIIPTREDSPA
jgi:nucleotide-binding universal stress UspA family protein